MHARYVGDMKIVQRIDAMNWPEVTAHLDAHGWAKLPGVLTPSECQTIAALYDDAARFRSRIVMARHGFGSGEYQYFSYPLPSEVAELRGALYGQLAAFANRWNEAMTIAVRYPAAHQAFVERCHRAGQSRPTPLLLRYVEGDFNALHQDVYGEHLFPIQAAALLSQPERDFTGGEFVLVEQRPRMQSRAEVLPLVLGDIVLWAVRNRPVRGSRGTYRVNMRHGVSRIRSGRRHTLGIIFHDAS